MLNDNFRSTFIGGQVVLSAGVADLPLGVRAQVVLKVQNYADFTPDNDPYGEHDFGSFEVAGETFFWKIDYYDSRCEFGRACSRSCLLVNISPCTPRAGITVKT